MACVYDQEKFTQFKAKSIQTLDELKIGMTVYSNWGDRGYDIASLISQERMDSTYGVTSHVRSSSIMKLFAGIIDDDIRWIIDTDGIYHSVKDSNITASYNPWLLFVNEADAVQCRKEMPVEIVMDDFDLGWDY